MWRLPAASTRGCSCPSRVWGADRRPGVIGSKPIHLLKAEDMDRANDMDSLYVDIGAKNKEDAEKLVKLGDQIVFATRCEPLGEGFRRARLWTTGLAATPLSRRSRSSMTSTLSAPSRFRKRSACAARAWRRIRLSPISDRTGGHHGPDVTETPEHGSSTVPGQGPAIVYRDASWVGDRRIVDRLIETAEAAGVPYQIKRTVTGGTDAGRIGPTESGVPVAVMSMPCRYIHSPVSVICADDLSNYVKLAGLFLDSLDERGLPV